MRSFYGDEQPVGMSVGEFSLTLLEMLASKKSPEALQTELFDLCGFERFDLISALLEHRQDLVKAAKETKAAIKMEIANAAASAPETAEALGRLTAPAYGCQVTVQSEDEKQLRKQMRKEEKKINKLLSQVKTSVKEFKG